jgi:hypothetical protein
MAKTRIQSIRNERLTPIEYQNLEHPNCNKSIPAATPQGGKTVNVNCDVPWAVGETEFREKRVEIQDAGTGALIAQIWQRTVSGEGDFVRVSTTGYSDPGQHIDGDAAAGGIKLLVVPSNGGVRLEDVQ